ncbi:transposase [Candidatus Gottesmanbacteria bacterium]|nr:transposase [Candidatus Gottesmanbacteria bacterium]
MPHKHSVKPFVADGFYHIYNRGVNKADIFTDDQDYRVFLHLLKYYLSPIKSLDIFHPFGDITDIKIVRPRPLANLEDEVDLVAFCLMPNHFHLLIKQHSPDGMTKLMRRLITTYSMYMNKRHKRVGHLFQGNYKAVLIEDDTYFLHLSRYIHCNPLSLPSMTGMILVNYPYSSYPYYLGLKHALWLKPQAVLDFFRKQQLLPIFQKTNTYQAFTESAVSPYPHDSPVHA